MHNLILLIIFSVFSFANNLVLQEGEIIAHTEIFGDSEIDSKTNKIKSILTINKDIESIKGNISIMSSSLISDNLDRDEHMYKVLNIQANPRIDLEIKSIHKVESDYQINASLLLNGVQKDISSIASITTVKNITNLVGNFSIKLTQFNMEPPSMLFITVRDQIDIKYNLSYIIENK